MSEPSTIDAVMAAVGYNTAKAGAGTSVVGWALSSEGVALIGLLIGGIGLIIQVIFQRRRDKREGEDLRMRREEHEARMRQL